MAGRRACRGAVRPQLRGRRREQHPAWRRRLRGLPVRDRRRRALAGPAPLEHGVDLRIRRPRRLLAAASRCSPSASVPVTVYGVATALARSPEQVAAMQEAGWEIASHGLKWIEYKDMPTEDERARHRRGDPPAHRGRPASARPAGTPAAPRSTPSTSSARKAASPMSPTPMTTTCPTGASTRAAPQLDHPLYARRQRHALRHRRRASTLASSSSPI